ncbi:hypothetical protein V2J09_010636 [Rumex salicifolius]
MEISLRQFELSDVGDFLQWAGDDEVTKYLRWNTFTSEEEATEFLKGVMASHPWYRAICVGAHIVGSVSVSPGSGIDARRGEIAYAIKAQFWGMGIATQAVEMAVKQASAELRFLDRIEGFVFVENTASQRVLDKAGFHKEGILNKFFFVKGESKDIVVYSVI